VDNMLDKPKTDSQTSQSDELDRLLDAGLAKYAAVEPRPGLEVRVLAKIKIQTERNHAIGHPWWYWGLAGALAAIIVAAAVFAWRSDRTTTSAIGSPPSVTTSGQLTPTREPAKPNAERTGTLAVKGKITRRRPHPEQAEAANPKLDQFPSRRPLTEQEKMALDYVRAYPEEAGLVARVQANLARQQELEELQRAESPGSENQE